MEITIDLEPCVTDHTRYGGGWGGHPRTQHIVHKLQDEALAREAYKSVKLTQRIEEIDALNIIVPERVEEVGYMFVGALIGPAARKIGPAKMRQKLRVLGGSAKGYGDSAQREFDRWLHGLEKRIQQKAEKEHKKANPKAVVWSPPTTVFVPDIGTALKLAIPWTFLLQREYRNHDFIELIGGADPNAGRYQHYRHRLEKDGERQNEWTVTVQAGAVLKTDRVYIRQGKGFENFSSLTFRMDKGATVCYNGREFVTTKNIRFWANLSDVNNIMAEVDLNTLPGQEKEGTARKD